MSVEFLPEGFLRRIFAYFGAPAPTVITLAGLFLSGAGLDRWINPALWLVYVFASLILVYSARHYISKNYLRTVLVCLVLLPLPIYLHERISAEEVAALLLLPTFPATLYLQAAVFLTVLIGVVPLAAYRNHELAVPLDYPVEIVEAFRQQIADSETYFDGFRARVDMCRAAAPGLVQIATTLDLQVVNRLGRPVNYTPKFTREHPNSYIQELSWDGVPMPTDNPNLATDGEYRIEGVIPPRGSVALRFSYVDYVPMQGSFIFVGYRRPARTYEFRAGTSPDLDGRLWIEVIGPPGTGPLTVGRQLTWTCETGLLPNQGVRLRWRFDNAD